jgi:hypothetical protein
VVLVDALVGRWRFVLAVLVVGASVLTACGGDDSPAEVPALSVEQLMSRSADTPIAVRGFLVDQERVTRLCEAILESYPPQCGEPFVELVGLEVAELAGTQSDQGITWKESLVVTVQRRQDARFDVLSVESG